MRKPKGRKLVLALSAELDDAIAIAAESEALDKSAWARRQLALAVRGAPLFQNPELKPGLYQPEPEQSEAPSADPESLVASALADAEAQGLTEPQEPEESIPESGVRALVRPAVPFTPNSHQHLNRYMEHLK